MADVLTRADLMDITDKLDDIRDRLARVETLQQTEAERLPFGEMLSQLDDHGERLGIVEGRTSKLEVTWARVAGVIATAVALGGSAGAVVAKLIP